MVEDYVTFHLSFLHFLLLSFFTFDEENEDRGKDKDEGKRGDGKINLSDIYCVCFKSEKSMLIKQLKSFRQLTYS